MDYYHLGEGDIGRVCMGRPTKKDTKRTIRPFFIQPRGCSKAIKELKFGVCSYLIRWVFYPAKKNGAGLPDSPSEEDL